MSPVQSGITNNVLNTCADAPNCVCSDDSRHKFHIEPLRTGDNPKATWHALRALIAAQPRTTIVEESENYLHAEARSRIFRFVDDVEFHLRPDEGIIAVRSESRLGYSDLGVNRRRVESIRQALAEKSVAASQQDG